MDSDMNSRIIVALCILSFTAFALAQRAPRTQPTSATTQPAEDHLSVTDHEITLHGSPLHYQATAGTIAMKDEEGKPRANMFFVAYNLKPAPGPTTRPITFVFNGGPGAASVFLHLGTVGPMRLNNNEEGDPGAPPHVVVENQETWLDATDLVFIDPVGTGFSRPAEGINTSEFYGVEQDISSVADFIRLYLTRYERWNSPKFLAGESYGTTRAAGLSLYLADHYGIDLNGIVLISTVLNFQAIDDEGGNDLPYALYLPSFTAIAEYHHRLTTPPDETRQASEKYAIGDYMTALAKGNSLTADERDAVADKLVAYTGLPKDFILKSHLRISPDAFRKHLLNDQAKILGRYDARLKADDPNPATDELSQDPSDSLYGPAYSSAFNDYVRRDLKFETDIPYVELGNVWPWNFHVRDQDMGYLDVSGRLRDAMLQNPHLRVLVNAGFYDLATPFASVDYTITHMDLGSQISQRITQAYFPSGHMIYHYAPARRQLREDVGTFIQAALAPATEPAGGGEVP
jgi:carboxypeptidase C (cathepsin A)